MSVEVHENGLTATVRRPGWPLLVTDTPLGIQKRKEAIERTQARFKEAYRCEINGHLYRLRCMKVDDEFITDGAVCEWLYNGEWRRVLSLEILSDMKKRANRPNRLCRLDTSVKTVQKCRVIPVGKGTAHA